MISLHFCEAQSKVSPPPKYYLVYSTILTNSLHALDLLKQEILLHLKRNYIITQIDK